MFKSRHMVMRTALLTVFTMIAFAANSVLCRLALGTHKIDAAGFTAIRLVSGAAVLFAIISIRNRNKAPAARGSWLSSLMLFIYAATFSFAYNTLDTGTGALILFGAVQITMILLSMISGNRLHMMEWMGVFTAFAGFIYLLLPGVSAPSVQGFFLMTSAGIAWGVYTLRGRNSLDPTADTAYNFIRSVPFVLFLLLLSLNNIDISNEGLWLAIMSGAITSGLGYVIWYMALGGLSTTLAAVVQLSVPVIAAIGGIVFVSEKLTLRLVVSTLLILGGILLVIYGRYEAPQVSRMTDR